jgi:hypothetical protein
MPYSVNAVRFVPPKLVALDSGYPPVEKWQVAPSKPAEGGEARVIYI